jgi:glycosidase
VPIQFWADWNQALREVNPDVYTITEIWHDASTFLSEGGFSATMNYYGFALPTKAYLIDGALSPSEFGDLLTGRLELYDESYHHSLQNCIESHDTDRLASMIVNRTTDYRNPERFDYDEWGTNSPRHSDTYQVRAPNTWERERLRLVALFQYTFVGAPMLYYGTEAGMWGADDPDDRKPMVWEDLDYEDEKTDPRGLERLPDPVSFDVELRAFYRDLGSLRREYESLRRGAFDVHESDDSDDSFSFIRSTETESLWILLNPSSKDALFTIPTGMVPRPVFHANQEPVMMLGVGQPSIKLVPNSGAIIDLEANPQ